MEGRGEGKGWRRKKERRKKEEKEGGTGEKRRGLGIYYAIPLTFLMLSTQTSVPNTDPRGIWS